MRLTKNDMARVIVTALYNMKFLAPADHPKVVALAKNKADHLTSLHKLAVRAIQSVMEHRRECQECAANGSCDDCPRDNLDQTDPA